MLNCMNFFNSIFFFLAIICPYGVASSLLFDIEHAQSNVVHAIIQASDYTALRDEYISCIHGGDFKSLQGSIDIGLLFEGIENPADQMVFVYQTVYLQLVYLLYELVSCIEKIDTMLARHKVKHANRAILVQRKLLHRLEVVWNMLENVIRKGFSPESYMLLVQSVSPVFLIDHQVDALTWYDLFVHALFSYNEHLNRVITSLSKDNAWNTIYVVNMVSCGCFVLGGFIKDYLCKGLSLRACSNPVSAFQQQVAVAKRNVDLDGFLYDASHFKELARKVDEQKGTESFDWNLLLNIKKDYIDGTWIPGLKIIGQQLCVNGDIGFKETMSLLFSNIISLSDRYNQVVPQILSKVNHYDSLIEQIHGLFVANLHKLLVLQENIMFFGKMVSYVGLLSMGCYIGKTVWCWYNHHRKNELTMLFHRLQMSYFGAMQHDQGLQVYIKLRLLKAGKKYYARDEYAALIDDLDGLEKCQSIEEKQKALEIIVRCYG